MTGEMFGGAVAGVGTDLLYNRRLEDMDDGFKKAAFTPAELAASAESDDEFRSLCARFAGKEAVFKSLRGDPDTLRWNQIEILPGENGAPEVTLYGPMLERARELGVKRVHLSLSWETDYALAFAVAAM